MNKLKKQKKKLFDNRQYCSKKQLEFFKKRVIGSGLPYYIKQGSFATQIVWDRINYIFPNKRGTAKGFFLFVRVRNDALKFIKANKDITLPKRTPANYINHKFDDLQVDMGAVDLNHAYWRIAYNLGVITQETYIKGLKEEFKEVRLAALSVLGQDKTWQTANGSKIRGKVKIIGNAALQRAYMLIRYTCYQYMLEISKLLGEDFVCYKTDCIYFVEKKANRKIVHTYLKKKGLFGKDLYS